MYRSFPFKRRDNSLRYAEFDSVPHGAEKMAAPVLVFVVAHGHRAESSAWNAGSDPLFLQPVPEPVGIITAISQEPLCSGQIVQQDSGPGVIADLASRYEEPDRAAISVRHRVQLRVHAVFGPPDQAAWGPFFPAGSRPCGTPSGRSRRS